MGFKMMKGSLAVLAALLVWGPSALAATPKEIYRDLADNGRLDRTYTQAEMSAFLKSATVQGYGNPVVVAPPPSQRPPSGGDAPTEGVAGEQQTFVSSEDEAAPALAETATAGTLPFTGAELGLFALVGGVLLLGGIALRASARQR